MKYRLLFISILSILFASVSFNIINSNSLEITKESMKMDEMMYRTIVNQLYDRINELEN